MLWNDGSATPDAFDCYIDGMNRCDPDFPLPAPGTSSDYFFMVESTPEQLLVSAFFQDTNPTRTYEFSSVQSPATIEVRMNELAISASCTSGCALSGGPP